MCQRSSHAEKSMTKDQRVSLQQRLMRAEAVVEEREQD